MERNKTQASVEILSVFALPGLGENKYALTIKIGDEWEPKIGYFITLENDQVWKITGIVSVGINKNMQEIISSKQKSGVWDIIVMPIIVIGESFPVAGQAKMFSELPPSILGNQS